MNIEKRYHCIRNRVEKRLARFKNRAKDKSPLVLKMFDPRRRPLNYLIKTEELALEGKELEDICDNISTSIIPQLNEIRRLIKMQYILTIVKQDKTNVILLLIHEDSFVGTMFEEQDFNIFGKNVTLSEPVPHGFKYRVIFPTDTNNEYLLFADGAFPEESFRLFLKKYGLDDKYYF